MPKLQKSQVVLIAIALALLAAGAVMFFVYQTAQPDEGRSDWEDAPQGAMDAIVPVFQRGYDFSEAGTDGGQLGDNEKWQMLHPDSDEVWCMRVSLWQEGAAPDEYTNIFLVAWRVGNFWQAMDLRGDLSWFQRMSCTLEEIES